MDANHTNQSHTYFTPTERISPRLKHFLHQLKSTAVVMAAVGLFSAVWWVVV